jgi:hypothetical protein
MTLARVVLSDDSPIFFMEPNVPDKDQNIPLLASNNKELFTDCIGIYEPTSPFEIMALEVEVDLVYLRP